MKISVIIPVYKVEQYLDECVRSVINQTYQDLEIILVDDGSPDNCPFLCDEYAKKDKRFKVIHKENGGLSDARNAGLKIATGEYVIFLDSDDYWLNYELINILYEETKEQKEIDLILFRRKDYYEGKERWITSKTLDLSSINDKNRNDVFEYLLFSQSFNMSACFQMIRRELLIKNNLFFEKGQLSEDIDWSLRIWLQAKNIKATNIEGYAYRHREESITTTYNIKHVSDFVEVLNKWFQIIKENGIKDTKLAQLYLGYLSYLYPTLIRNYFLIARNDRKEEYQLLISLKGLIQFDTTPKSKQLKKLYSLIGFRLTCISLGLYGLIKKRGFKGLKNIF